MAYRKPGDDKRKIQLISLIDLIFILLIFFILTSILVKTTKSEAKLYLPTPKNEPGEAQVLIQILDRDAYLWFDHSLVDTLYRYSSELAASTPEEKMAFLTQRMVLSYDGLNDRIQALETALAKRPDNEYFVLIRCPEDLPFHYATEIIEKLVHNSNLEYGCVAGTIKELKNSRNFSVQGNVVHIDFE